MKTFVSGYWMQKTKASKKIVFNGVEVYTDDQDDQAQADSLLEKIIEFTSNEFSTKNPVVKKEYYIEYWADFTKTGKMKNLTGWYMRPFTDEEMESYEKTMKQIERNERKELSNQDFDKKLNELGIELANTR